MNYNEYIRDVEETLKLMLKHHVNKLDQFYQKANDKHAIDRLIASTGRDAVESQVTVDILKDLFASADQASDFHGALRDLVKRLERDVLQNAKSGSRSTNIFQNAVDEAENCARAQTLEQLRYNLKKLDQY